MQLLVISAWVAFPVAYALEIGMRAGHAQRGRSSNSQEEMVPSSPAPLGVHMDRVTPASVKPNVLLNLTKGATTGGHLHSKQGDGKTNRVNLNLTTTPMMWPKLEDAAKAQSHPKQEVPKKGGKWVAVTWLILIAVSLVCYKITHKDWSPQHRAPITSILIILWSILAFATLFFYCSAHDWSFLQCIYFCIVTLSTVGHGDYVPSNSMLDKVLLLIFVWFNMLVLSVVWNIAQAGADAEIEKLEGKKADDLRTQALSLLGLVIVGAIIFMYLESWSFLQGITYATVTLSTVGYGYLLPNGGTTSMICACIFILVGVPFTAIVTGKIGAAIDESFKTKKQGMSSGMLLSVYVAIIVAWLLLGASGFYFSSVHGWSWSECFYVASVTMTTVGYGDYVPESTLAMTLFTLLYIWGSVCVVATVFFDFDELLMDLFTKGMNRHKALFSRLGLLSLLILVGTVIFDALEGWGWLNSFVYTSVTSSTIGFGHFYPTTDVSRACAVAYIVAAVPLNGMLMSYISREYSDVIQRLVAH